MLEATVGLGVGAGGSLSVGTWKKNVGNSVASSKPPKEKQVQMVWLDWSEKGGMNDPKECPAESSGSLKYKMRGLWQCCETSG